MSIIIFSKVPSGTLPVSTPIVCFEKILDSDSSLNQNSIYSAEYIEFWLSDESESKIFSKQTIGVDTGRVPEGTFENIIIDTNQVYQEMDGFGFALNGGSAMHLFNMGQSSRSALLNELFGNNENSIKASYLRVSIGASDLDLMPQY